MKLIFIVLLFFQLLSFGQVFKFSIAIAKLQASSRLSNSVKQELWEKRVYYIGAYKDTIELSCNTNDIAESNKNIFSSTKEIKFLYYHPDYSSRLQLFFDTSQVLPVSEIGWKKGKLVHSYFQAYPVLIKNNSDSIADIGFGYQIPIIVEAMDTDKQWKPIERPYLYKCGNGLATIYLQPDNYACVLMHKYKGSYKTQLRLRLKNIISDSFRGEINREQFIKNCSF